MKIKYTLIALLVITIIVFGIYFKIQYDNKKEAEEKYYNEQKERITLYMKHNVKDYKTIEFTEIKKNPMDGYDISGYINNDKKLSFSAGIRSTENFQFNSDIAYSDELDGKFVKNTKTVSQIKKEQEHKQDEN